MQLKRNLQLLPHYKEYKNVKLFVMSQTAHMAPPLKNQTFNEQSRLNSAHTLFCTVKLKHSTTSTRRKTHVLLED